MLPTAQAFREHLAAVPGMPEKAQKTYRSGYNRILRDLHPDECLDPLTLNDYRVSMRLGTRNVFNVTWKHLHEFTTKLGAPVALPPAMNRVRFAHPLMHDVLTLTGYLNVPQLASLTWGTVPEHAINDSVERALGRIYEFQTGRAAVTATADTPLIPTRHGLPMREWQVEYIVNSIHHETDHPIDRGANKLAEALVHAGVNGVFLRDYMTAYWNARPSLVRSARPGDVVTDLITMVRNKNFVNLRRLLSDKASKLAGPVCW